MPMHMFLWQIAALSSIRPVRQGGENEDETYNCVKEMHDVPATPAACGC